MPAVSIAAPNPIPAGLAIILLTTSTVRVRNVNNRGVQVRIYPMLIGVAVRISTGHLLQSCFPMKYICIIMEKCRLSAFVLFKFDLTFCFCTAIHSYPHSGVRGVDSHICPVRVCMFFLYFRGFLP